MTIEPLYRSYAKGMLDVDELPESLEYKLAMAEGLIRSVKPGGCLCSTHSIAIIIMLWELEQTLEKFDNEFHLGRPV